MAKTVIEGLRTKTSVIGIVGLGYVGLPLVLRYSEQGYKVVGFDIDPEKVSQLNAGRSYIGHLGPQRIVEAKKNGFEATTDFSRAGDVDALIICVPTPLNIHREPDLSFVTGTVDSLLPYLRKNQVMSLESTTYPGTTEEELLTRIQSRGFVVGEDYFLV